MRCDPALYQRALERMSMSDDEWAEIEPLMPPQIGKKAVDWRFILDVLALRFAFAAGRGVSWTKVETVTRSSTIRMALDRLIADGALDRIAKALPTMKHARQGVWAHIIRGARVARAKKQSQRS